MSVENQAKLEKIKKASIVLRALCMFFLTIATILALSCVVCVVCGVGDINYDSMVLRTAGLPLDSRVGLGAMTAVTFGVLIKCFYHLHRLFGNYASGEIFTRKSVAQFRQFGVACLLWGVMSYLWILSLTLTTHATQSFQGHADAFIIGTIIVAVAWFMEMAVDLQEENELTI